MKKISRYLLPLAVILCVPVTGIAQKPQLKLPRFDIRTICTIPETMSNGAFQHSFDGVFQLNMAGDYRLFNGFFAGLAVGHGLFEVTPNKIPNINTNMRVTTWGGQLGYDIALSDIAFFSVSAGGGQSYTKFTSVYSSSPPPKDGYNYYSNYMEGELNLYFKVESNFAIGINFSYNIVGRSFDPYYLSLNDYRRYKADELAGSTGYLNFGFGFYYGFMKRKSSPAD